MNKTMKELNEEIFGSSDSTTTKNYEFYPEDRINSDKLDALEKKMDENFEKIIDMLVDMNEKLLDMLERRWE